MHCADDPASIRAVIEAVEAAVPPGAWPNYVLGNHDEHRVASRAGETLAPLLMMLLLTPRGTPTIDYGDELGLPDVPISPAEVRDPWERGVPGLGLGRDPQRSPMPWDTEPNGGYCAEESGPWLPLVDDLERYSVATQLDDPGSMLSLTRRLLRLRRESMALRHGTYRSSESQEGSVAFVRELGAQRLFIALNFTSRDCTLALPTSTPASRLASTHHDREGSPEQGTVHLAAHEGSVVDLGRAWAPT